MIDTTGGILFATYRDTDGMEITRTVSPNMHIATGTAITYTYRIDHDLTERESHIYLSQLLRPVDR